MIPHTLHIKNFLSYGPETQIVDFKPYNLISLSGKNGHGKSALLDAITWAIWGQARKTSGQSKPDAGLLHLGQKHMMVILEFEVNGTVYRVRREFLHTQSKAFTTLDFGIQNSDGKLVPLTDKTIKDTQDKIEKMIGITYDAFTNSTFLRQGQSNEFSNKSPKERKEILAQILQLQQFEDQKKIALHHARQQQIGYQAKVQIQNRITQELAQLATITQQYEQIEITLTALQQEISINQQQLQAHKVKQQQLQEQQNIVTFLEHQQQELYTQQQNLLQSLQQHEQKLTINTNLPAKSVLLELEQKLNETVTLLQKKQQDKLLLKEQYLTTKEKLQTIIQAQQEEYLKQEQVIHIALSKNEEASKQLDKQLQQAENSTRNITKELTQFQQLCAQQQQQLITLTTTVQQYEQHKKLLEQARQEYQQLCSQGTYSKQYVQKLQNDEACLQQNNRCLLCTQNIDQQHKTLMAQKLQDEQLSLKNSLQKLKEQAQLQKIQVQQLQTQQQNLEQEYEHFLKLQTHHEQTISRLQATQQQLEQHQSNVQKIHQEQLTISEHTKTLQAQLAELQKSLETQTQNSEIAHLWQKLQEIETLGKQLTIDPQQYQTTQQELSKVRQQLEQHNQQNEVVQITTIMQQLQLQVQMVATKQLQNSQELAKYQHLPQLFAQLQQEEKLLQENIQQKEKALQDGLMQKNVLQHQQQKKYALETELDALNKDAKILHQEMTDYQEIAKALGKDGIQALLIEQAIPEIEHETNQILSRLTNNQTQIFIESLRDLKKGGSKETLDIKISDPFGLRDYELFSGGEAFRIDFALRIGISKLLARRAGTTLQTIFIDEGFGSQDEEGLNLIMDNIHKIQEDFAKIVIVSHLPEMKEHFPIQFIIEKKRSGSTISVVQQG